MSDQQTAVRLVRIAWIIPATGHFGEGKWHDATSDEGRFKELCLESDRLNNYKIKHWLEFKMSDEPRS
jgi:hypothetical protein